MKSTESAKDIAVEQALAVLKRAPAALITDIDGTISHIVSRPEDAVVGDAIRTALETLSQSISLVAVITAREEAVARRMVGLESLTYVGNYALDKLSATRAEGEMDALMVAVRPLLHAWPGVMLEEKGIGFSLHYRNCSQENVREALLHSVSPMVAEYPAKVLEGKQVLEVVPLDLPDKGSAFAGLLDAHGIQGVVYLGDDLSDIPVFRELSRRRAEGSKPSLGIAVVDPETQTTVRETADLELEGVDATEEFLTRLCLALQEGAA